MKALYILPLLIPFCASSQNLQQEVDVEHDVELTHRDFNPLRQYPSITLAPVTSTPLKYSQRLMAAPVTPALSLLEPAAWTDPDAPQPWRGYVAGGYWPTYHLGLSAGYRFIDTDRTRLSAWAQLNGANYKRDDQEYKRTTVALGAHLRQAMGALSYIDADLCYRYNSFNPPCVISPALGYSELSNSSWHQYTNRVDLSAAWHSSEGGLKYNAGADYQYFGYRNAMPLWADMPTLSEINGGAPETGALNPVRENRFRILADGRLPITDTSTAGLDFAFTFLRNSRSSSTAFFFPSQQWAVWADDSHHNHALIELTPRYIFTSGKFTANIGVKLDISTGYGSAFRVAPDATVCWEATPLLTLSAQATGGTTVNSLASLFEVNHLNVPMLTYPDSHVPLDALVKLLVGPRNGFYGQVFAGYSCANDWLMPRLQRGASFFESQSINGWRAGVRLGAAYKKYAELEAGFTAAQSGYKKGYYLWRDRARYVADATLTVHPLKPLDVTLGWEMRACRSILDVKYRLMPEICVMEETRSLGNISDINLSGTWRFSKSLSFFASLDNLLNRHPLVIGGIPMEGFHGLIGAEYKF